MDEQLTKAYDILNNHRYLNLATVTPENLPWNTPLYYAFDKDLNFYWHSWVHNQHSHSIQTNPNAYITIYEAANIPGFATGVYMQGTAKVADGVQETLTGLKHIYIRQDKPVKDIAMFQDPHPRRVYMFTPQQVWLNNLNRELDNHQIVDTRAEMNLNELKNYINNIPDAYFKTIT